MRVAVTGARGRIGRPLVDLLAADPRVEEVVAIDSAGAPPAGAEGVRQVRRDTRDPGLAGDLAGVDALVHLAFRVLDPRDAESVNVDGSRNVFERAIAAGAGVIVHASSGAVYGGHADNPVPLREHDALRPAPFAYPRTKVVVERMLEELGPRHPDVRIAVLRPTTSLGPHAPLLMGRGAYLRLRGFDPPAQFTWVDDVASAFAAAVHADRASGVFNVGAEGTVPTSQVAAELGVRDVALPYRPRRAVAAAMTRLRLPGALHPGFVDMARHPIVVDAARARDELGWSAGADSLTTLRRFGEWLRDPSRSGR